jgi:hypothetical protein
MRLRPEKENIQLGRILSDLIAIELTPSEYPAQRKFSVIG